MDTSKISEASTPESAQIIYDFLTKHHIGVLATVDTSGKPHGAVIYFVMNDDFTILFGTKTKTRKYENIAKTGVATLVVYDEDAQMTTVIQGKASQSDDPAVIEKAIANMEAQSAKIASAHNPPITKLYAGDFVAMRLVPHTISTAIYMRPDNEGFDEFETITFSGR
jgi:general stress protein 26